MGEVRNEKGQFGKGHMGRPPGTKSERLKQWDELKDSIVGEQADRFREYLNEMWDSPNPDDRNAAAELYLKTLEYFKPKQARVTHAGDQDAPIKIVIPPDL